MDPVQTYVLQAKLNSMMEKSNSDNPMGDPRLSHTAGSLHTPKGVNAHQHDTPEHRQSEHTYRIRPWRQRGGDAHEQGHREVQAGREHVRQGKLSKEHQ